MNQELRHLSQPSLFAWLWRVLLNWFEITLLFLAMVYFDHWSAYLAGGLLLGTRQHALALLAHEAIHRNISRRWWINNTLGNLLAGLPLFQSLGFFKVFHLNHHAYMLTEKDPEVDVRNAGPHYWSLPLTRQKRVFLLLRDLCGVGYLDTRHALPHILKHLSLFDIIAPVVFWACVVTVFVKLSLGWIPLFWTVSFVTSYWAMFRQRALTEHIGVDEDKTHKLHANWLERFFYLPHNTWYHYEHHYAASVPCWNLPKLRALIQTSPVMRVSELYAQLSKTSAPKA